MSAGHCHIIRNLTPPHLSKNEPSLPGLGDADVARSRRRRVISTVEPDEPASNFQQCDNGRVIACCQLSSAVPCSESQPSQRFLVSLALRGCRFTHAPPLCAPSSTTYYLHVSRYLRQLLIHVFAGAPQFLTILAPRPLPVTVVAYVNASRSNLNTLGVRRNGEKKSRRSSGSSNDECIRAH